MRTIGVLLLTLLCRIIVTGALKPGVSSISVKSGISKVVGALSTSLVLSSTIMQPMQPAHAIDVSQVKNLNDEVSKLKQVQDALDARDIPYEDLPSGVSYREFRDGKGERRVQRGAEVVVELTLRAKKLATQAQPGGVMYFSTAKDTTGGTMGWTIGDGTMIPGIEEAMMAQGGMKRSAVRRIEVPSTQVFKARRDGQLPLQKDADEIRLTKNLWKTEATMIAEVKVNKISEPLVTKSPAEVVLGDSAPKME